MNKSIVVVIPGCPIVELFRWLRYHVASTVVVGVRTSWTRHFARPTRIQSKGATIWSFRSTTCHISNWVSIGDTNCAQFGVIWFYSSFARVVLACPLPLCWSLDHPQLEQFSTDCARTDWINFPFVFGPHLTAGFPNNPTFTFTEHTNAAPSPPDFHLLLRLDR